MYFTQILETKMKVGSIKEYGTGPNFMIFQVGKLSSDYVGLVAYLLLEENNRTSRYGPGYCLKCGSDRDLESSYATVDEAWIYIRRYNLLFFYLHCIGFILLTVFTEEYSILDRLQDAIISKEISRAVLLDASRFLGLLRSILHAYNKSIAEVSSKVPSLIHVSLFIYLQLLLSAVSLYELSDYTIAPFIWSTEKYLNDYDFNKNNR